MLFPSASHFGTAIALGKSTIFSASPPANGITYSVAFSSSPRFEVNAMRVPSGLHIGASSVVSAAVVSWRTSPVAIATDHRLLLLLFFSMFHCCTGKTANLPSGESAGVPTRLIAHKSCGVRRRGSAADAAAQMMNETKRAKTERSFMTTQAYEPAP